MRALVIQKFKKIIDGENEWARKASWLKNSRAIEYPDFENMSDEKLLRDYTMEVARTSQPML